jgi:phosphogluconate dehydratase
VALLTDGRMSGASGKVLAAIHLVPEAADGGPISRLRAGDVVRIDAVEGTIDVLLDDAMLRGREPAPLALEANRSGTGRELFGLMRAATGDAEAGACSLFVDNALPAPGTRAPAEAAR